MARRPPPGFDRPLPDELPLRERSRAKALLDEPWPADRRAEPAWARRVNAPETEAELAALLRSVTRGAPFGGERWTARTAGRTGLASTLRERGRPRKVGVGAAGKSL